MNPGNKKSFAIIFAVTLMFTLSACSVHEQKEEGGNKKVDIETPFAAIHVGTDTNAKDTGLEPYPGAKPKADENDKHRANISIGGENFGLHVVAATYTTDDPPVKVIDFYRKDLKRYGDVLECPRGISENKHGHDDDGELKCSNTGEEKPGKLDMAVGIPDHQRIVSVKPNGSGTEFSLVYIQVQGKRETM